jgi:hypothetical protein
MFIREKKKKNKSKRYCQYQLIESVRTPAGPRQTLVLNLGTLKLHKDKWKHLANRIEGKLHGQPSLFASDLEIEKLAEHYSRLIIKKRQAEEAEAQRIQPETEEDPEYETVDLNSGAHSDAMTIGAEHVVLSQMAEYKFDEILKSLKFDPRQINYAKMLVVGRLAHPASERETARWLRENSGLLELLQTDIAVYDTALHRVAALMWENHEAIERSLSKRAKDQFSLRETIILYDLTNTYFAGSKKGSKIAKPGAISKEKRHDRPLVTLALVVDDEGFPKLSKILEGNVSEPSTLEGMLDELDEFSPLFNSEKTIVMDAGIATEDNLKLIRKKKFHYVAVSRKQTYEDGLWDNSSEKQIKLADDKTKLTIKLSRTKTEAFLHCHSEAKEAKEKAIFERKLKKFEDEINSIKEGLKKKGTQKSYEKIVERIGRLKEKYKVGSLYDLVVEQEEGVATGIIFNKNSNGEAVENSYGEYVLRTDRMDLADEEISKIHRSLTTVEASFRSMKSELGMRPNYHKRDEMTIAHILITVIGYHFLTPILKKLKADGLTHCWNTVREILANHVRVTTAFNTEAGDTVSLRTSVDPRLRQQEIYNALKIKHNPLKRLRTIIPKIRIKPHRTEVMEKM